MITLECYVAVAAQGFSGNERTGKDGDGEGKDGGGSRVFRWSPSVSGKDGKNPNLSSFPGELDSVNDRWLQRCHGGGGGSGETSRRRWWLATLAAAFGEVLF
ncbi:hypothetical protein Hanom_Chr08g00726491 [Helianthus anomalus]